MRSFGRRSSREPRLTVLGLVFALGTAGPVGLGASVDPGGSSITEETRCLAMNVYHEARGEPVEGKLAIAAVTLNRVRSARFPDTVCGVVWQPGQFSWTADGRSDIPRDEDAWQTALRLAEKVYPGKGEEEAHAAALFFHSIDVEPAWAKGMHMTARIGAHVFLRPRD